MIGINFNLDFLRILLYILFVEVYGLLLFSWYLSYFYNFKRKLFYATVSTISVLFFSIILTLFIRR